MPLIKWNRDPFGDFSDDFDEFFNSMMMPAVRQGSQKLGLDLAVDVYEEDGNIIAEMNLPGISPDDVNVDVEEGYLKISGNREQKSEERDEKKNYYTREIRRGSFQRMVKLPAEADSSNARAKYSDGVLQIVMLKRQESETKPNRLEIEHD